MILSCPNCNRKYKLGQEYAGKFIQCICKNVLKVPESSSYMAGFGAISQPPEQEDGFWSDLLLPSPTALFNFDRYGPAVYASEPEPSIDVPNLDEEMPSFDEDGDIGFEEMNYELPDLDNDAIEAISEAQQAAFDEIKVEEKKPLDPRLPRALEELTKSTEPRFIVELLYYLLEIKDLSIESAVQSKVANKNPMADYFAKRIVKDISKLKEKNAQHLEEFPRAEIFSDLFFGSSQTKIALVEKALEDRWFASVPYFMVQLMRERDVAVLCAFLTKLGLLASPLEAIFFGKFVRHTNRQVRLASIDGLSGIGGASMLPALVEGLGETDPETLERVQRALRGCDKLALARQIRSYLANHQPADKTAYIAALKENANSESFRTLVWLLEDTSCRSYALGAIRDMAIEDDLKMPHMEEFLLLTNDDTTFCHEIVEYMEALQPGFDSSRFIPITVFDDSYISQVRFSPLFAKDFENKATKKISEADEEFVELEKFSIADESKKLSTEIKYLLSGLKPMGKSAYFQPYIFMFGILVISTMIFVLFSLFKGQGSAPMSSLPINFLPTRFLSKFSESIFSDAAFLNSITLLVGILCCNLVIGWFLGSSLAVKQLKSFNLKPKLLPSLPLLISPVLIGYAIPGLMHAMNLNLVVPALFLTFLFPAISIFYIVYLRMFTVYPRGQFDASQTLGADPIKAFAASYGPVYHVGSLIGAILYSIYALGSLQLSAFIKSDLALGYVLLDKTRYYEGWLMVGAYGSTLAIMILVALFITELLVPLASLFPAGSKQSTKNFTIQRWSLWLSFLGWLYYSRVGSRGKVKSKQQSSLQETTAVDTTGNSGEEGTGTLDPNS